MLARTEYTEHGRWGGRLTRRELPTHEPLFDELSSLDRERLAAIWLHRAAMERRVADSFEIIRKALVRRHAAPELVSLASRAIDDEYRHAELSRVVASRFAGVDLESPPRLRLEVPRHAGASPELRDTLFVVGQCVLNETTASVFLETCLKHARGELARCALQELLSDEIDHSRIGWAHLASLDAGTRAELAPWLLPMAYLNLQLWQRETPIERTHAAVLAQHGAPPAEIIHLALVDALRTLIVPGLEQLSIDTEPLQRWLRAGAFTDTPPREFVRA